MTENYLVSYVLSLPNAIPQFKSSIICSDYMKEAYVDYVGFCTHTLLQKMGISEDYIFNCSIIAISAIPNKED